MTQRHRSPHLPLKSPHYRVRILKGLLSKAFIVETFTKEQILRHMDSLNFQLRTHIHHFH